MIENTVLFYILLIHFLADFCLQTPDQARLKSTDIDELGKHVLSYSLTWFLASYIWFEAWHLSMMFALVTFILHFITDYVTSRIGKPYWEKKDYHTGFVVVGADQVLHYIQLILTYQLFITFI